MDTQVQHRNKDVKIGPFWKIDIFVSASQQQNAVFEPKRRNNYVYSFRNTKYDRLAKAGPFKFKNVMAGENTNILNQHARNGEHSLAL